MSSQKELDEFARDIEECCEFDEVMGQKVIDTRKSFNDMMGISIKEVEEEAPLDSTRNNGGETDYYAIPEGFTTHQDVIEQREMNYAQGNIYKVACTFNVGRHSGTDYERDLNKIVFFAKRELKRIKSGK